MTSLIWRYLWRGGLPLAADDEGRPRLVDEDRVDLVHDRVVELALRVVERAELHVVAQVVEAELVVLAVRDVRPVRGLLLVLALRVDDGARREPEEAVEAPHPLRVALGEVVVHRDDVNALAFERVQVAGEGRDEGLPFARAHFGDRPFVEDHPADKLHVVVPHLEDALPPLAADGEGLGEDVVERRAVLELLLELGGLPLQLGIAQLGDGRLEGVDRLDARTEALDLALVRGAEDLLQGPGDHERTVRISG